MEGARARQAQRGARGKRSVYAAKGPGARARGATVRTMGEGRLRGTATGATRDADARVRVRPQVQCPPRGHSRLSRNARWRAERPRQRPARPPAMLSSAERGLRHRTFASMLAAHRKALADALRPGPPPHRGPGPARWTRPTTGRNRSCRTPAVEWRSGSKRAHTGAAQSVGGAQRAAHVGARPNTRGVTSRLCSRHRSRAIVDSALPSRYFYCRGGKRATAREKNHGPL
jgi:hypothetical protein